eukprot:1578234-Amphidinium_carterae.1
MHVGFDVHLPNGHSGVVIHAGALVRREAGPPIVAQGFTGRALREGSNSRGLRRDYDESMYMQ